MLLFANPRASYEAHKIEIEAAIRDVLESGVYVLGIHVQAFEADFAAVTGVTHGIGVASGTDALSIALRGFDIGPGDEVITVSHTSGATVAAIKAVGATPRLVDVDSAFHTIDPARMDAAITPLTRAVIVVHLYGQPADMDAILPIARERSLAVIEDCAQAHCALYKGRPVGSLGDVGCFSFYPTKNLGAFGDGGMIVTDDAVLARKLSLLRLYGWTRPHHSEIPGLGSRLDELHAAVLRIKLKYLTEANAARRRGAARYDRCLGDLPLTLPRVREGCGHVYHLYVVRCRKRDALRDFLKKRGILAGIHYPEAVHQQPAYRECGTAEDLPVTENLVPEILSLPLYPELTAAEQDRVIDGVQTFFGRAQRADANEASCFTISTISKRSPSG